MTVLCSAPATPTAHLHPAGLPCLEQHDVVRHGAGVILRMLVVSENSPDLLRCFWFIDVVSPQDDCGIPDHGSRRERRKRGWVTLASLPFLRQVERAAMCRRKRNWLQDDSSDGPLWLGEKEVGKAPVQGTHPMQCAAVITQSGATRKPPQADFPIFRYAM